MPVFQPNTAISHAYALICADEAQRARETTELAAAMLCTSDGVRPCRVCRDCKKVFRGVHPDVICTDPTGSAKTAAIKVDQVREIIATAHLVPSEGKSKVYVLRSADKMNPQAQNALLKLLEEPPSSACFILAAENAAALLPTVRSRCELLQQNAEASPIPEAALTQARAYIAALSSRSRARLVRWCNDREKDDYDAVRALFDALRQLCAASLAGESTLPDETAYALLERLDQCQLYLKANVGLKHIFGLLSLPCGPGDDETELRKSH